MKKSGDINIYLYILAMNYINNPEFERISTIESFYNNEDGLVLQSNNKCIEDAISNKETYSNLSSEAKEVINTILNSPKEVIELLITPKHKKISAKNIEKIFSFRWNSSFIAKQVIKEIKRWILSLT